MEGRRLASEGGSGATLRLNKTLPDVLKGPKISYHLHYRLLHIVDLYGGPGQKSPDYRASDAEGTLKSRIKIAHTR
jgi:hypothetical protein